MLLNKLRIFQKISKKSKNIFRIQTNVYTIFFGFIEIFVKKKKKLSKNVHEFKKGLEWKKIERKNCRKKRKTGVRTGPVHLDPSVGDHYVNAHNERYILIEVTGEEKKLSPGNHANSKWADPA